MAHAWHASEYSKSFVSCRSWTWWRYSIVAHSTLESGCTKTATTTTMTNECMSNVVVHVWQRWQQQMNACPLKIWEQKNRSCLMGRTTPWSSLPFLAAELPVLSLLSKSRVSRAKLLLGRPHSQAGYPRQQEARFVLHHGSWNLGGQETWYMISFQILFEFPHSL